MRFHKMYEKDHISYRLCESVLLHLREMNAGFIVFVMRITNGR